MRVSSIRELMQLARHLKTDLLFYFDYSPLQVITNISSHITQPVKRLPLCYDASIRSTAHQGKVYPYFRLP